MEDILNDVLKFLYNNYVENGKERVKIVSNEIFGGYRPDVITDALLERGLIERSGSTTSYFLANISVAGINTVNPDFFLAAQTKAIQFAKDNGGTAILTEALPELLSDYKEGMASDIKEFIRTNGLVHVKDLPTDALISIKN